MRGKVCFKCGETKPRSEFYNHPMMGDGKLGKCKSCTKKDANEHRRCHLERIRKYDRIRSKLPHRISQAVRRTKRSRKNVRGYENAHNAVARAIIRGRLQRKPCEMCGTTAFVAAHHDDYSKPLAVMWLCPIHHASRHAFVNYRSDGL